jgi:hypothetical protein
VTTSAHIAPMLHGFSMSQPAPPQTIAAVLISALRSPVHASAKLRPIADELEAIRARS